jgi:hypothetical protein
MIKKILKFIWKKKKTSNSKTILSKKSNAGGVTVPDFKFTAIAIKPTWYWFKNRLEDQWNRTEDPEINPYVYTHLLVKKKS